MIRTYRGTDALIEEEGLTLEAALKETAAQDARLAAETVAEDDRQVLARRNATIYALEAEIIALRQTLAAERPAAETPPQAPTEAEPVKEAVVTETPPEG